MAKVENHWPSSRCRCRLLLLLRLVNPSSRKGQGKERDSATGRAYHHHILREYG